MNGLEKVVSSITEKIAENRYLEAVSATFLIQYGSCDNIVPNQQSYLL